MIMPTTTSAKKQTQQKKRKFLLRFYTWINRSDGFKVQRGAKIDVNLKPARCYMPVVPRSFSSEKNIFQTKPDEGHTALNYWFQPHSDEGVAEERTASAFGRRRVKNVLGTPLKWLNRQNGIKLRKWRNIRTRFHPMADIRWNRREIENNKTDGKNEDKKKE